MKHTITMHKHLPNLRPPSRELTDNGPTFLFTSTTTARALETITQRQITIDFITARLAPSFEAGLSFCEIDR